MKPYDDPKPDQLDPGPFGVTDDTTAPVRPLGDSPDALQADILAARREMSQTIDAIQERLDPERLTAQLKQSVRQATLGKAEHAMNYVDETARQTGTSMLDTIRQNPVPTALVALGLAWLYRNRAHEAYRTSWTRSVSPGPGSHPGYQPGDSGTAYPPSGTPGVADAAGQARETAQRVADQAGAQVQQVGAQVQQTGAQARETARQVGDRVQGQVQQVGDQVQQLGTQVQGQVADLTDQMQDRAVVLGDQVQGQVGRARSDFERALRDNPLAVGAAALAVGVAVGLALPPTPQEDRLMGAAREQVLQRAQGVAQEALGSVQKVAEQVRPAAEQALQDQGLTRPPDLRKSA